MLILLPMFLGLLVASGVLLAVLAVRAPTLPTGGQLSQQVQHRHRMLLDGLATRCARCSTTWLAIPDPDLAILEHDTHRFLKHRIVSALGGSGAGILLGAAAGMTGLNMPVPVTVLATIALGAGASLLPVLQVRDAAATRRDEYRRALAAYLDLVAQERTAGRAPTPALLEAGALGDHRLFIRIAMTVRHAQRLGHTPWHSLRELGEHIGMRELGDVADLADTAATGAAVYTSLTTQAAALRHTVLTTEKAAANAATERLTLPACLLMVAFLLLVLYPTTTHLLS